MTDRVSEPLASGPSFYRPEGGGFVATGWTRGPWNDLHQHGGPPTALLGRSLEEHVAGADPPLQLVRVTFDFLRPVPLGLVSLHTEDARPGARVRLVAAVLRVDGEEVLRASGLFLRKTRLLLPELPGVGWAPPRPPASLSAMPSPFASAGESYIDAMELRVAEGIWGKGPKKVWMRPRLPLVAGEPLTPLSRVLLVADSGNGVSPVLDPREKIFVNPDLVVSLARLPEGEWVCLDASTAIEPVGIGLATTRLFDERGPFGVGAQSLFVADRA